MSTLSHILGCHTPEKAHISMETEEWQLFCVSLVEDGGLWDDTAGLYHPVENFFLGESFTPRLVGA